MTEPASRAGLDVSGDADAESATHRAPRSLLDEAALRDTVHRLGREIARDHPDGVVLVGVLKGALVFLADLARAIPDIEVVVAFIAVSRFEPGAGRVKLLHDVDVELADRDVIVVEDIVDTGLTLSYLLRQLETHAPRSLDVCTLIDRTGARFVPVDVRYRGVHFDEGFALGYGLHWRDLYRNVPYLVLADRDEVERDPNAYVSALYGAREAL